MSPEDDAPLSGFLDDYFAECDEHLAAVRRHLLALEDAGGDPAREAWPLGELFRSLHTIKGLSGMVGLRDAERLAHRIESLLGALRERRASLSPELLDALRSGVNLLEQLLAATRNGGVAPATVAVTERLAALLPSAETPTGGGSPPPGPERPIAAAEPRPEGAGDSAPLWVFEFIPSPELAARGVNVNAVRSRIEERGTIVRAAPRVHPAGGIVFEFLVALAERGEPPAAWREDGMRFHRREADPPATGPRPEAEAAARGPEPPQQAGAGIAPAHVVRVDLARLDEIMRLVGELVISRARLEDGLGRCAEPSLQRAVRPLQEVSQGMARQLRELREAVMRTRMVPVGEIFGRMQFVVRDLARESGKRVRLELAGQQTEIDKFIVERLADPLLHLVRNAVAHGLEPPEKRREAGKPDEGILRLRALTAGDLVVLEVEDDGAGIDRERVLARARETGLHADGEEAGEKRLFDILCTPGFSTRNEADLTSGRGVGLAVARDAVLALGGTIELDSAAGRGTRFTLRLPLTLAIADALIVTAGDQTFAVPQALVREVIEIAPGAITPLENNEMIRYRGGVLPLVRLTRQFGLRERARRALYGLVVGHGRSGRAVVVEGIAGRREIVVRAMADPLLQVPGIAGATELGDGRVVLILDTARLTGNGAAIAPRIRGEGG